MKTRNVPNDYVVIADDLNGHVSGKTEYNQWYVSKDSFIAHAMIVALKTVISMVIST